LAYPANDAGSLPETALSFRGAVSMDGLSSAGRTR